MTNFVECFAKVNIDSVDLASPTKDVEDPALKGKKVGDC